MPPKSQGLGIKSITVHSKLFWQLIEAVIYNQTCTICSGPTYVSSIQTVSLAKIAMPSGRLDKHNMATLSGVSLLGNDIKAIRFSYLIVLYLSEHDGLLVRQLRRPVNTR